MVHVAHGDAGHHDVLHRPLVHLLEGQSAAVDTGAVADGDVAVAAIALRAEFDASADPVDGLRDVGAVERGAEFVACDGAVGDEDVLAGDGFLQGV